MGKSVGKGGQTSKEDDLETIKTKSGRELEGVSTSKANTTDEEKANLETARMKFEDPKLDEEIERSSAKEKEHFAAVRARKHKATKTQPNLTLNTQATSKDPFNTAGRLSSKDLPDFTQNEWKAFEKNKADIQFISNQAAGIKGDGVDPKLGKMMVFITKTTSIEVAIKIINSTIAGLQNPTFTLTASTPEEAIDYAKKCQKSTPPIVLSGMKVGDQFISAENIQQYIDDKKKPSEFPTVTKTMDTLSETGSNKSDSSKRLSFKSEPAPAPTTPPDSDIKNNEDVDETRSNRSSTLPKP